MIPTDLASTRDRGLQVNQKWRFVWGLFFAVAAARSVLPGRGRVATTSVTDVFLFDGASPGGRTGNDGFFVRGDVANESGTPGRFACCGRPPATRRQPATFACRLMRRVGLAKIWKSHHATNRLDKRY